MILTRLILLFYCTDTRFADVSALKNTFCVFGSAYTTYVFHKMHLFHNNAGKGSPGPQKREYYSTFMPGNEREMLWTVCGMRRTVWDIK